MSVTLFTRTTDILFDGEKNTVLLKNPSKRSLCNGVIAKYNTEFTPEEYQ